MVEKVCLYYKINQLERQNLKSKKVKINLKSIE